MNEVEDILQSLVPDCEVRFVKGIIEIGDTGIVNYAVFEESQRTTHNKKRK